jgi:hypothetical protein
MDWSDRALRYSFLVAVWVPLILLFTMTRPPRRAMRAFLGQPAMRQVWGGIWLPVTVVLAMTAWGGYMLRFGATADVRRLWGLVLLAFIGAWLLGSAANLRALQAMAKNETPWWAIVSGGGAFGPAYAAPLLYAPVGGLVAAMLPVAFLAAVWGARPDLLTVPRLIVTIAFFVVAEVAVFAAAWLRSKPFLHAALVRVDEAFQTRFARSELLPSPPNWLTGTSPSPATAFAATVLHRRYPGALVNTSLACVPLLLTFWDAERSGVALIVIVAFAILWCSARVELMREDQALAAVRWLGSSDAAAESAWRALLVRSLVPALPALALAVVAFAMGR